MPRSSILQTLSRCGAMRTTNACAESRSEAHSAGITQKAGLARSPAGGLSTVPIVSSQSSGPRQQLLGSFAVSVREARNPESSLKTLAKFVERPVGIVQGLRPLSSDRRGEGSHGSDRAHFKYRALRTAAGPVAHRRACGDDRSVKRLGDRGCLLVLRFTNPPWDLVRP